MSNPNNMGTLIGRLARDPKVFENADGSHKVMMTVYTDRDYTGHDGARPSDAIPVEAFVSKKVQGTGPYAHVHKGDLVALQTTLQAQSWEKNGERIYETKVAVESIQFLEPKRVTEDRLAKRVAEAEKVDPAVQSRDAHPAGTAIPMGAAVQPTVIPAGVPAVAPAAAPAVAPESAMLSQEQLPFG